MDVVAVDAISISYQILRRIPIGEGLDQLLRRPGCGGMLGHIEMQHPTTTVKLTYQNNVWLAQDYWYTEGTLNFITLQREQKKTPISSIDRSLTFQLNRDCGLNFQLPR